MATYFANSVTGNDANAGTEAAPLQTLAAVLAKQASGQHVVHLVGDFTASAIDISTARWSFVGESRAATSITVTTALFTASELYQTFKHLRISGDVSGYFNANIVTLIDCEFGSVRAINFYNTVLADRCTFGGSLSNVYGAFSDCTFRSSVSGGNANAISFANCLFIGTGSQTFAAHQRVLVTSCTFYGFIHVQASSAQFGSYSRCVFHGGDTDRGATLPRGQYGYLYGCAALDNSAGWLGTTYFTQGHNDYTDLTEDPYPNAAAGDFSPSAELAALLDSEGRYPGYQPVAAAVLVASAGLGDEAGWWCPSLDTAGDGTTTVTDLSGNGNDGTANSSSQVTWETVDGKRALYFEGPSLSNVATAYVLGGPSWSVSCWMKATVASIQNWCAIVGCGTGISGAGMYYTSAGTLRLIGGNYSNAYVTSAAGAISDGAWIHVCGVMRPGGGCMYINGINVACDLGNHEQSQAFVFGGTNSSYNFEYGWLDDVRTFDRDLRTIEVEHLAKSRGVLGSPISAATAVAASHPLDN